MTADLRGNQATDLIYVHRKHGHSLPPSPFVALCRAAARSDRPRSAMKMSARDLNSIAARTIAHYNRHADDFWHGTRGHDVSQNIAALLQHIEADPPFTILDLGCGPGRDLMAFAALGHVAVGLEGAPRLAAMARAHSGCEVWQQDFLTLDLPRRRFDGVFANAVLFHIPSQELPGVLRQLRSTLKDGGVLLSSNPHGHNEEGWSGDRYGAYYDLETWRGYLSAAGFLELDHYYRPAGLPRERQPWLASVWRRSDDRKFHTPALASTTTDTPNAVFPASGLR